MLTAEEYMGKARARLEMGIQNKSQQKDVLDTINRAFYEAHRELSHEILNERNSHSEESQEYRELEQLYYKVPSDAYRWNEKVFNLFSKYEGSKKLNEIAKFWQEIKALEIVKAVKTQEQLREEKIASKIDVNSLITDKEKYMQAVDEMIRLLDNEVTVAFNKIAKQRIKISQSGKEELNEKLKDKTFRVMYNTFISGKTESQIKAEVNKEKEIFLLDTKLRIIERVQFNISSTEHLGGLKWKLNGNKLVEIETISAGGYNIQCLHVRTLVKIKELK